MGVVLQMHDSAAFGDPQAASAAFDAANGQIRRKTSHDELKQAFLQVYSST